MNLHCFENLSYYGLVSKLADKKCVSTHYKRTDIEEIEDGELNNRRWSYLLGKNEKAPSIFNHSSKGFDLVSSANAIRNAQ